jgi:uracil-DNA glycosylase
MPPKRNPAGDAAVLAGPEPRSLEELNRAIVAAPPLVPGATQAVLGEGPAGAAIALVGEQPGDEEDRQGRPFVGPAGHLLDRALGEAGIDRTEVYLTNAVKHFKFEARGKRRIHAKPTAGEVRHYRWWLMQELALVAPRVVVALGATALLALAGKPLPIMRSRGELQFAGFTGFVTVHPSYLLRMPDQAVRRQAYRDFVADLVRVRDLASNRSAARHARAG